jgi:hypothetical protein
VVLAEGEQAIREYHASESEANGFRALILSLFGGDQEGGDRHLLVTTKRLILLGEMRTKGGRGRIHREVQLERVTGISATIAEGWMAGWALLRLVGQGILGLVVVFILGRISGFLWVLIVPLIFWFISALSSQGRRVSIAVNASGASGSAVSISGQAKTGRFSAHYEVFDMPSAPGRDAERIAQELGALVLDVQADAAAARERWVDASELTNATTLTPEALSTSGDMQAPRHTTPQPEPEPLGPGAG